MISQSYDITYDIIFNIIITFIPSQALLAQHLVAYWTSDHCTDIFRCPLAKWGVHTYAEYAKSEHVIILHIAKGFTYFFLHILHIVLHILLHILHILLHILGCVRILHTAFYTFRIFIVSHGESDHPGLTVARRRAPS